MTICGTKSSKSDKTLEMFLRAPGVKMCWGRFFDNEEENIFWSANDKNGRWQLDAFVEDALAYGISVKEIYEYMAQVSKHALQENEETRRIRRLKGTSREIKSCQTIMARLPKTMGDKMCLGCPMNPEGWTRPHQVTIWITKSGVSIWDIWIHDYCISINGEDIYKAGTFQQKVFALSGHFLPIKDKDDWAQNYLVPWRSMATIQRIEGLDSKELACERVLHALLASWPSKNRRTMVDPAEGVYVYHNEEKNTGEIGTTVMARLCDSVGANPLVVHKWFKSKGLIHGKVINTKFEGRNCRVWQLNYDLLWGEPDYKPLNSGHMEDDDLTLDIDDPNETEDNDHILVLQLLRDCDPETPVRGMHTLEIQNRLGMNSQRVGKAIDRLVSSGQIFELEENSRSWIVSS